MGKSSSEGQGLFSLQDDGLALAELIKDTLEANSLTASDIDVVIAHANGNQKSDDSEALAIQAVFGDKGVAVTGFKWLMGHTLCASGLLDLALAAEAINTKIIPALATCNALASSCQGQDVVQSHREIIEKSPHALIINRGFGSMNAVVIVKGV
jgi:3-oxoacyl-[acyl-carrier-protein] synthase-1